MKGILAVLVFATLLAVVVGACNREEAAAPAPVAEAPTLAATPTEAPTALAPGATEAVGVAAATVAAEVPATATASPAPGATPAAVAAVQRRGADVNIVAPTGPGSRCIRNKTASEEGAIGGTVPHLRRGIALWNIDINRHVSDIDVADGPLVV